MRELRAFRCWTVHTILVLTLAAALALGGAVAAQAQGGLHAAEGVPAGLTAADWASLRHQVAASRSSLTVDLSAQQAYLKASSVEVDALFGYSVAISGDTAIVGARFGNNFKGKAYIFVRNGSTWSQQAYLTAASVWPSGFGSSVAISGDTVVVGAQDDSSGATGVNGDPTDTSALQSGAAYVFVRSGSTWSQQAYLKASNTETIDMFGSSVAISGDTVVVGTSLEASNATGVNGDPTNNLAPRSGAAYVFARSGSTWSQQAYLKASNSDSDYLFGDSVAVSGDTVVVGALGEKSNATGVNGNQADKSAFQAGATYVFVRSGSTWSQQAYLKASNTEQGDGFGSSVAISGDTVVVGARGERSNATGVNHDQTNNSAPSAGAAYVFVRNGSTWSQQAYLKASNTEEDDWFGWSLAVSGDMVVVGALNESSNATGVNGDPTNNSAPYSGAAYVFVRSGTTWFPRAYLKASNPERYDELGQSVAISGATVIAGDFLEDSDATGVNGDPTNNSARNAGAAYVFTIAPRPAEQIPTLGPWGLALLPLALAMAGLLSLRRRHGREPR